MPFCTIDSVKVDNQYRIILKSLWLKIPEEIVFLVDEEAELIIVKNAEECDFGTRHRPDKKGRVIIPKWIREGGIKDYQEVFLMVDENGQRYISPKTAPVLPSLTKNPNPARVEL